MHLATAISGSSLVNSLLYLLVIGVIFGLLLWIVSISPIPEPFKNVLKWLLYVVGVIFVINFLLGLIGHPFIVF